MKSVLIATDIIKTQSGEIKILEINTNTRMSKSFDTETHNLNNLITFIQTNNFQEVYCILPRNSNPFGKKLKELCENIGVEYIEFILQNDSITVPYIEDSETKLIIRISYDTTAIIDEDYCRDKFKLQEIINNKTYGAKTYIQGVLDNFSDIGDFEYDQNVPNFIVKKRHPQYDKEIFPKLYKIQNLTELNNLKNTIEPDCYLQEFLHSDLINGKRCIIRSLDLLYGGELNVLNITSFYKTSQLAENYWENDFDSDGLLAKKDRFKYVSHAINDNTSSWDYVYDVDQEVVMSDGSRKTFENLQKGDQIKAVHIEGLPINEGGYNLATWTGDYNTFIQNYQTVTTEVVDIYQSPPISQLFLRVTLNDNETQWDDLVDTQILIKDNELIKFKRFSELSVGDNVITHNFQTNLMEVKQIQEIGVVFKEGQILGSLDAEPVDVYLPLVSQYVTIVQHNVCTLKFCRPSGCLNPTNCNDCTTAQCEIQK